MPIYEEIKPIYEEIKSITVQTDDGAMWSAHIDEDDELVFDSIITPPKSNEPKESEKSETPPPSIPPTIKEMLKKMESKKEKEPINKELKDSNLPDDTKRKLSDKVFRAKLQSTMLDNKYDRRLKGRTRGKLDMKALFKVPTQSKSVFTQKQARKNKEYNVCLLVDESGSMSYNSKGVSRAECAAEATAFLANNFDGININLCIIGFNQNISILKDWNTKTDYDKVYSDIKTMHHDYGAGDNNDYDALYRGYQMLKKAPNCQNILIMLSDGRPEQSHSCYYDVNGKEELACIIEKDMPKLSPSDKEEEKHLHNLVKSNKDVISIGIGIQQGGWQIPNHFVVNNLEDLKPQLISVLKNNIKRG